MRWLRGSSETPQLVGLSPLKVDDDLYSTGDSFMIGDNVSITSAATIHGGEQKFESLPPPQRNQMSNHSTRKSRIGKNRKCFKC
jgi:hypothetical protein